MFEQFIKQLISADEKYLYRILSLLPRKKRREFLKKIDDVVKGKSDLLKSVVTNMQPKVKEKFINILTHYNYGKGGNR